MDGIPDHSSKTATGDFSSDPCEKVRGEKVKDDVGEKTCGKRKNMAHVCRDQLRCSTQYD